MKWQLALFSVLVADYNATARHVTRIPSAISRRLQLRTQDFRMLWLVAAQKIRVRRAYARMIWAPT